MTTSPVPSKAPATIDEQKIVFANNEPPHKDGCVRLYKPADDDKNLPPWFDRQRRAIFINGQLTTAAQHLANAKAVSEFQMCPVIGVFNKSAHDPASFWLQSKLLSGGIDTLQSLGDKLQFHSPASGGAEQYFEKHLRSRRAENPTLDRVQVMKDLLRRNLATLKLFQLLRAGSLPPGTPIVAHSQGCLIACNALTARALLDGPDSIRGQVVHAFGSPAQTANWPKEIQLYDHAFTGDPISLLNWTLNFKIAKVGLPAGLKWHEFVTHGFEYYLNEENGARFIINRFRWGSGRITLHLDEAGLARFLVQLGDNEPRLRAVFKRLASHHQPHAGRVASAYVQAMLQQPYKATLQRLRSTKLTEEYLLPLLPSETAVHDLLEKLTPA